MRRDTGYEDCWRFKEKAPRGETGPFLRREQLGEARLANADDAETFPDGEA
jgi:hypothetical protein